MHRSAVVVLAIACAVLGSPTPIDEDVVNVPITGTVVSSRNTSVVYAGVPVKLYNSDKDHNKLDLVETTTTSETGKYTFLVAHSSYYEVCAFVNGFDACVSHNVPAVKAGGRNRRLTDISTLTIPVPSYLGDGEFEIQLIWPMDLVAYQYDWDSVLVTPYGCLLGAKETNSYGWCCDEDTTACDRNAANNQDSFYGNSPFGFETISLREPGPGSKTYKHFVYGYGLSSSFDTVTSFSQGLVRIYKKGPNGNPTIAATPVTLSTETVFEDANHKGRFWHTFTLTINNGVISSVTDTNRVACTPLLSTGSTATLTLENGARGC